MVLNIGLRGGAVRDPFLVRVYTIPQSAEGYAEGETPGHNIKFNLLFKTIG